MTLGWSVYRELGDDYVIQTRQKNDKYPYFITILCPLTPGYQENMGAVVVNINVEKLGSVMGRAQGMTQTLLILDDEERLYSAVAGIYWTTKATCWRL